MRLKEKLGNYLTLKTHKSGGAFSSTQCGHALTIRCVSLCVSIALCAIFVHSLSLLLSSPCPPISFALSPSLICLLFSSKYFSPNGWLCFVLFCFHLQNLLLLFLFSLIFFPILSWILREFFLSHFLSFEFILSILPYKRVKRVFSVLSLITLLCVASFRASCSQTYTLSLRDTKKARNSLLSLVSKQFY